MTTDTNKINRIFKKMILTISIFLISFFALTPVKAAAFKYSEFDWDKFAEKNKNYWLSTCETTDNVTNQPNFEGKNYKSIFNRFTNTFSKTSGTQVEKIKQTFDPRFIVCYNPIFDS